MQLKRMYSVVGQSVPNMSVRSDWFIVAFKSSFFCTYLLSGCFTHYLELGIEIFNYYLFTLFNSVAFYFIDFDGITLGT